MKRIWLSPATSADRSLFGRHLGPDLELGPATPFPTGADDVIVAGVFEKELVAWAREHRSDAIVFVVDPPGSATPAGEGEDAAGDGSRRIEAGTFDDLARKIRTELGLVPFTPAVEAPSRWTRTPYRVGAVAAALVLVVGFASVSFAAGHRIADRHDNRRGHAEIVEEFRGFGNGGNSRDDGTQQMPMFRIPGDSQQNQQNQQGVTPRQTPQQRQSSTTTTTVVTPAA
jgi:hypothetical protein